MKPTKRVLTALGKVFAAEMDDRLPLQSNAWIYHSLVEMGLLTSMERIYGHGPLRVTVTGYQLTHAGRILYCSHCESDET